MMGSSWEQKRAARAVRQMLEKKSTVKMDKITRDLLAGRLTLDHFRTTSPLVRVFFCSAGTDTCTERTFLVEHLYPKLREYCRHTYGLEFQVVDLAWGLTTEQQTLDPDFATLKIQEILKCQKTFLGPNFVAFIGQKYGDLPLPASILADKFEEIRTALNAHRGRETRNAPLLDKCYVIDTNNVPPVYVIKKASDIFPDITSEDEQKQQEATENWRELEMELSVLLQRGAELAYLDGKMDNDACSSFFMSDLEREVQTGIERCDSPSKRCVLILRDIVDLKNYVKDPRTPQFTEVFFNELTQSLELNSKSQKRMQFLKNRARGLIPKANTLTHEVLWRFEDVIHPTLHREYLQKLCDQMYELLKRLVDECTTEFQEDNSFPLVAQEALQHWTHCKNLSSEFFACQPQLQQLRNYVTGSSEMLLVLYGPSGCGKTKLVSRLAMELSSLASDNLLTIIRYVGLTLKSCDLRYILMELCTQILLALGYMIDDIPTDSNELHRFFPELLGAVPQDITFVLILDGLEQLSSDDNADLMSWLPVPMPSNVKIILTVLPDHHNLFSRLQTEVLVNYPSVFLEVQPLSLPDSLDLLNYYLSSLDRQITQEQMAIISQKILDYSLPLYVKLIAEEVRTLHSFTDFTQLQFPSDCAQGIENVFSRLDVKHGRLVMERAMAFMLASQTGLSDLEMEDLLSLDDMTLNYIFRHHHHPPLRRIPSTVWLKIRGDLEAFLTVREIEGVLVSTWEHDSFRQAARERYMTDPETIKFVHSLLADYFLGTWANKPKAVELEEEQAEADRLVPVQPHTFRYYAQEEAPVRQVIFNRRKLEQVPRHLYFSGRCEELNWLVLFNYKWLYNKIQALTLQHVLTDFTFSPTEQALLVQEALRTAAPTLKKNINNLPAEITGRLLPYYTTHPYIRTLIDSCDLDGLSNCALLPNFPYQQIPGSPLQFTLKCPEPAQCLAMVFDESFLVCKKADQSHVYVFDLLLGKLKDTIFVSNGELYVTPNGRYFIIVDHVTEKSIKIHDSDNGVFLSQVILLNYINIQSYKYKAGPLTLTDDRLCTVAETENTSIVFICEVPSGSILQTITLKGKTTVCQISANGKHLLCNSDRILFIYDVYSLHHVCAVPIEHKPSAVVFTRDGLRAFMVTPQDDELLIVHLCEGRVEMIYKARLTEVTQGDVLRTLTVAPNDKLILIRTDRTLAIYRRTSDAITAYFRRPEHIPEEFRLPKSYYKDLVFTNAEFIRDSECIVGTIFRDIYIWEINSQQLIFTIQSPIGIISLLLVCQKSNRLVTHIHNSSHIHVWKLQSACKKVDRMDKLTAAVQRVLLTEDNSLAFIQCQNGDEVGVVDMSSGTMLDLLTHGTKVRDMAITPSGDMALVNTVPRLSGTACKLWNVSQRQVIMEFGDTCGYCLSMHCANSIVLLSQPQAFFDYPYDICIIHFTGDTRSVYSSPEVCKYVRSKPVITYNDHYLVISSALDHNEKNGKFLSPCLVVFDMAVSLKRSYYDDNCLDLEGDLEDIIDVHSCPFEESSVAVVAVCRRHPGEGAAGGECREVPTSSQVCLFILDVREGRISTLHYLQLNPDSPFPPHLIFSADFTLCVDETSCIYNLRENTTVTRQLAHPGTPPQCLAMHGSAVVYYKDTVLYVLRVCDSAILACCEVHAFISHITLCSDQRTLVVGCHDGTLASYVLVDPVQDPKPDLVVAAIKSRQLQQIGTELDSCRFRIWDKVDKTSTPSYSRPPSAVKSISRDKMILQEIEPLPRFRPKSDTVLYYQNHKSQACCLM